MSLIIPRDYQENSVNNIIRYIANGFTRVVFQLATGGGKTVCLSYLLQRYLTRYPFAKTVVLVHREELKQQTLATLQGFGISNVYVEMVETFHNRIRRNYVDFDVIIIDECHIGNFKKIFQFYPTKIIIGLSATPISATKKHPLKADYQSIVCGIDTHELIASGNLVRAKTYQPQTGLDKKGLKMSKGDYALGQMGAEFSKPKLVKAVLESYLKYASGTKTIIYNTTIEHSKLVNDLLVSHGLPSRHLDSFATPEERKDALIWLNQTPDAILNNVGILTTGFDEPSIQTIVLNRCTKSLPLYLQMSGRGARPYPNKDHFNIIDLGDNSGMHGLWSEKRDWEYTFHHPDKPGEGVAPVKECPECEAIIHASVTVCPECGHEMPREVEYSHDPIILALKEDIKVQQLIKQAQDREYKPMWGMHQIVQRIKKAQIPNEKKEEVFMTKLREFYKESGKRLYQNNINYWNEQLNA